YCGSAIPALLQVKEKTFVFNGTVDAAAAESRGANPVAEFRGKDCSAADLFHSFVDQDNLVLVLDASNLGMIKPNTIAENGSGYICLGTSATWMLSRCRARETTKI
ncbi:hypothetical protein ACJX0J_009975, partial [Zea mays]